MKARKIDAMHKQFGQHDGKQCRDCCHLISGEWHVRRYHKCELYGLSHSEATDWRLKYQACGAYNVPREELDVYSPYLQALIRERNAEPPIEGQIKMEV